MGLKKSRESLEGFRPWSEEEWQRLEGSMHLGVAAQQATFFPDRTLRGVEKARERLRKKQRSRQY
jgi:hypothetical protein